MKKRLRITIGNQSYDVTVEVLEDEQTPLKAVTSSAPVSAPVSAPGTKAPAASSGAPMGGGMVQSPMAGSVKAVRVRQGETVTAGQVLVVLDSMKMETDITAPQAGGVEAVHVSAGDSVAEGQVLVELR
jgi:methylmalonyl-CoA carboxyltransferase small subunit